MGQELQASGTVATLSANDCILDWLTIFQGTFLKHAAAYMTLALVTSHGWHTADILDVCMHATLPTT